MAQKIKRKRRNKSDAKEETVPVNQNLKNAAKSAMKGNRQSRNTVTFSKRFSSL